MAVPAIDPVITHMVCVAELNRLLDKILCAGDVGAAAQANQKAYQADGQEEPADNTGFRKSIGARLKNLWHRMLTNGAPA
jgi:hypothetical protein